MSGHSTFDIIITGGGIVGLATAYRLKEEKPQLKILLLEKETSLAKHQTGNNSGVIHSGIYYKPGSLKAKNCIEGYQQLLAFCDKEEIDYELCGKVIVATSNEELPAMENIYKRGNENGLQNLKKISAEELKEYEPHVNGVAAIHVPQTGIIDYKLVAKTYGKRFKEKEGLIHLGEKVVDIQIKTDYSEVVTNKSSYQTKLVVNCAGLYSDKVAGFTISKPDVRIVPFRGEYYELTPEKHYLVKNLIYPVPDPNFPFLGVHFTRMIKGGIEAGPNAVFAFKREGYHRTDVNVGDVWGALSWPGFRKVAAKYWRTGLGEIYRSFSKAAFTKALQKLIPEIEEKDLVPGGAGVRAQACDRTGGLLDDFKILEDQQVINVLNAPSPAATSSLSIGKTVANLALERL